MKRMVVAGMLGMAALAAIGSIPSRAAAPGASDEIAALKKEIAALKKSEYHPELGDQMLGLQIRHARLWFAGQAQNWTLAAFEVQEIKEAFDGVVEHNGDHATFQPQRLADVLQEMTKAPIRALRDAIDHGSKAEFGKAFDELSAGCTACHRAAGNDFLVIERPKTPLLDNLRAAPAPAPAK
jgi:hypothetical protein